MTTQIVQAIIKHAPGDKRPYGIDFVNELDGANISEASWTVDTLTKSFEEVDGTLAKVFLAGGVAGNDYVAACTITTDGGEILTRSLLIRCEYL